MPALFQKGAGSVAALGASAILQVAAFILLARILGAKDYAVIVGIAAIVAVTIELIGLGGGDSLIKETAQEPSRYHAALGKSLWLIMLTYLPVLALDIVLYQIFFGSDGAGPGVLCLLISELLSARFTALGEHIGIARQRLAFANGCRILPQLARLAMITGAYGLGLKGFDQWWPLQFFLGIATSLAIGICAVVLFGRPEAARSSIHWKAQFAFAVSQQMRALQSNVDRFAAGTIISGPALGAYGVAARFANLSLIPVLAILRITYPNYFREGKAAGFDGALRYAFQMLPYYLAIALASALALLCLSYFIGDLLGADFAAASQNMRYLAALPVLVSAQYALSDALAGGGLLWRRSLILALGLGLIAAMTFAGAALGGIKGVALGLIVANVIVVIVFLLVALWSRGRTASSFPPLDAPS